MSPPHDHDHDHDHPHDHGEPAPPPPQRGEPVAPAAETAVEDPGTRALAEALRSSFVIVKVVMVVLVILFFVSGVFLVPPQERAIILRFGKPVGTGLEQMLGPGLHWSFPKPIDEVVRLKIGQLHTVTSTVGWYATTPQMEATGAEPPARQSLDPSLDSYTLTADGNIIHVRATLAYRITDPLSYAFQFSSPSTLLQNALNNSILYASSRYSVDRALRLDIIGFKETIVTRLNQLIAEQNLGVTIESPDIKVVVPPYVRESFNEVLIAEQGRNTLINQARGYEGEILSRAIGESNAVVNTARADYVRLTNSVASEARYLNDRLAEYNKNSELFRQRMLAETMQQVLTNAQYQFLLPNSDGGTSELRLLLSRQPARRPPPAPPDEHEDRH